MQMTTQVANQYTYDDWGVFILIYFYSGLKLVTFCKKYSLNRSEFDYWNKELSPKIFKEEGDVFLEEEVKTAEQIEQEELQEDIDTDTRLKAWSTQYVANKHKYEGNAFEYLL